MIALKIKSVWSIINEHKVSEKTTNLLKVDLTRVQEPPTSRGPKAQDRIAGHNQERTDQTDDVAEAVDHSTVGLLAAADQVRRNQIGLGATLHGSGGLGLGCSAATETKEMCALGKAISEDRKQLDCARRSRL
uniref:Uncharacterized protein n=1 Tax=Steinernema glaseri TaxID=37863 RepID=A0A1I8A0Z8_9BILA